MSLDGAIDRVALLTHWEREQSAGHDLGEEAFVSRSNRAAQKRQRRSLHWFSYVLVMFLTVQLAYIIITQRSKSAPNDRSYEDPHDLVTTAWLAVEGADCGGNVEEARAKNCIFDIMRYAWTPRECYDREAAEAELADNPWRWYLDSNGTSELQEDHLEHHETAFTHWGYHVRHCAYLFKLAVRASKSKAIVPFEVGSFAHMLHCGSVLADNKYPLEMKGTAAYMGFTECGTLIMPDLDPL